MAAIMLFNYPEPEQKAWRFLLRRLPKVEVIPVEPDRFGLSLEQLLQREAAAGSRCGGSFSERLAVFAGAEGTLLGLLLDVSGQVTREKAYRAVLTDTNRAWSASELMVQLKEEEAQLNRHR